MIEKSCRIEKRRGALLIMVTKEMLSLYENEFKRDPYGLWGMNKEAWN